MHKKSLKRRLLAWMLAIAMCVSMCDGAAMGTGVVYAEDAIEAPVATASGTYTQGQRITISQRINATIFYCLSNTADPSTSYQMYSSSEPIIIDVPGNYELKTYAFDGNTGLQSSVAVFNYEIKEMEKAATPTVDLESGTYNQGQTIILNCATENASIYYTLDGTTPSVGAGNFYNGIIRMDTPGTYYLRAFAVAGGYRNSDVTEVYTYTILETAGKPTSKANMEPDALGIYRSAINVQILSETEDAEIYYTLDGTEPTTESTKYTGVPLTISTTTVIKAIAVKEGMRTSSVSTFVYNIQVPQIIRNMKAHNSKGAAISSITVNYGTTLTQLRAILGALEIVPTMATNVTGPSILNSQEKWDVEMSDGATRIMENATATATFTASDCIPPDGTAIYTVNDGKVVLDVICGNIPISGIRSGSTYIQIPDNATDVYIKTKLSELQIEPIIDSSLGVNIRECQIDNNPACWTIEGDHAIGTFTAPTGYVFDDGADNTLTIDLEKFIPITEVYTTSNTIQYYDCDVTDAYIMRQLTEMTIIGAVPTGYAEPVLTNNATCWTNSGSTQDGGTVYTGNFSAPNGYGFTGFSTLTITVYRDDIPITQLTPSAKSVDILFSATNADVLEELAKLNIVATVKAGMTRPIIENDIYCWSINEDGTTATGSFVIPSGYQCEPSVNQVTVSIARYTPITAMTTSKTEMAVWYDTPSDEIKEKLAQLVIRAAVPAGAQIPDIENTTANWNVSDSVAVGKFEIPDGYRLQGAEARIEVTLIRRIPVTNIKPSVDTIYTKYYASVIEIQKQLVAEVSLLPEVPEGQKPPTILNDTANRWVLTNMKKTATATFTLPEDSIYSFGDDYDGKVVVNVVSIIPVSSLVPSETTIHVPYDSTNQSVYEALSNLTITGTVPTGEVPLILDNDDVWELNNETGTAVKTFTAPDGYEFAENVGKVSVKVVRDIPVTSLTPSALSLDVSEYASSSEIKRRLANLKIIPTVPEGTAQPEIGNRAELWEISEDGTSATGSFVVSEPYTISDEVNKVTVQLNKYYPLVSVSTSKNMLSVGYGATEEDILQKLLQLEVYGETERAMLVDLENTEDCWSINTGLKQAYGTFEAPEGYRAESPEVMKAVVGFEYVVPVTKLKSSIDSILVSSEASEADVKTQLATLNIQAEVPEGELPPTISNQAGNWVVSGSAAYGNFSVPEYYKLEEGANPVEIKVERYIPVKSLVSSASSISVSYNAGNDEIFEELAKLKINGLVPEGQPAPTITNEVKNWEIFSNYAKGTFTLPSGYRYSDVSGVVRVTIKRGDIPVESVTTEKTSLDVAYGTSTIEIQRQLSRMKLTAVVPNGYEEPYISNELSAWTISGNVASADFVLPSGYTYAANSQKPLVVINQYVPVYGLTPSQESIDVEYDADELEILALLTTLGISAEIPEGATEPVIANSIDCWDLNGNTAVGTFKLPSGYVAESTDLTVSVGINYSDRPPVAYMVNYYGGDGATGESSSDGYVTEGSIITLPANPFTKKGYNFIGWVEGTMTYASGSLYTMPSHSVSFVARWEADGSSTTNPSDNTNKKKVKVGTKWKGTKGEYKVLSGKKARLIKNITKKSNYLMANRITIGTTVYKVTEIGAETFKNTKATRIVVPKNIRRVKAKAFYGSSNIKKIIFKGTTVPTFNKGAFKGLKSGAKIYVPKKKYAKYKKAIKKSSLPSGVKIVSYTAKSSN